MLNEYILTYFFKSMIMLSIGIRYDRFIIGFLNYLYYDNVYLLIIDWLGILNIKLSSLGMGKLGSLGVGKLGSLGVGKLGSLGLD